MTKNELLEMVPDGRGIQFFGYGKEEFVDTEDDPYQVILLDEKDELGTRVIVADYPHDRITAVIVVS